MEVAFVKGESTLFVEEERYNSIFEIVEECKTAGMVIYGAGFWGIQTLRIFNKFGISPVLIADDDIKKQDKYFSMNGVTDVADKYEIKIKSLDDAVALYPNAVYISAVTQDNNNFLGIMNNNLKNRGLFSKYSSFLPMKYMVILFGGLEALKCSNTQKEDNFKSDYLENVFILNHMSNSGSVYFNTLVDNHPNILNITHAYNTGIFPREYNLRLQYLEDEALVIETAAQFFRYFKWDFPKSVLDSFAQRCYCRVADRYFVDKNGNPEQAIYIDGAEFISWLSAELYGKGKVSSGYLLKAVFSAYNNTIGKKYVNGENYWIFYENHTCNFDTDVLDQLIGNDFQKTEYWFIIRETVQHISSLIKYRVNTRNRFPYIPLGHISTPLFLRDIFSCDLGIMLQKNEKNKDRTIRVIRFEDVKRGEVYMRVICDALGIPYNDCLLESTFNGVPIYFPTVDNTGRAVVITGNDTTPLERKDYSEMLSSFDIFRINLVTQDFKRKYGYVVDVPHYSQFSMDTLKELFIIPFTFTEALQELYEYYYPESLNSGSEKPDYHGCIAELFLSYMEGGKKEMFSNILYPK
jgi:hypothetical protein